MNYIDLFAVLLVVLWILIGYNQGFLKSICNVANIILSLVIALIFYGIMANDITDDPQIIPTVVHFSEASELLGGIETESISIYERPIEELNTLVENTSLPFPLARLLQKNLENQAFASKGIDTLGDYLGQTIGSMTINYISFIIVFAISYTILMILISVADYATDFPVLQSMDAVAGGIGGFIQGLLLLNVIFLGVPLILAFLPFEELMHFVENSSFAKVYYYQNILIRLIRGII